MHIYFQMVYQKLYQNVASRWGSLEEINFIYNLTSGSATNNQAQNGHPGAAADTRCQIEAVISNMVSTPAQ